MKFAFLWFVCTFFHSHKRSPGRECWQVTCDDCDREWIEEF